MSENASSVVPVVGLRVRFQRGIAWSLVGGAFNQGGTFGANVIVANLLGRQVFGEYAMIQSTLVTLAAVAQLATGYTATKYVAEFRSTDQEKTGRILGLCSVVSAAAASIAALALLTGSSWLATHTLRAPHLAPGLMIASGVVLFAVVNGYQMGALAGLESYPSLGKAGIISGILYLGVCAVAAWAGGLNGAVAGLVVSALLQWVILNSFQRWESIKQRIVVHYCGLLQESAVILKFALPAALTGFVTMPALWLANTFLVRQPGGYDQMALYTAANSFRIIVLFLPNITNNVGMSLLNNQKGAGDELRYRKVFWVNMALTVSLVAVGSSAVVLFGPWLLGMFGQSFGGGYPVLLVLMLATIPEALYAATYQVIQSHEKLWQSLLAIALPRDASIVLWAYMLSPLYGALGLAWAYTLGSTAAFVVVIALAGRLGLTVHAAAIPNRRKDNS